MSPHGYTLKKMLFLESSAQQLTLASTREQHVFGCYGIKFVSSVHTRSAQLQNGAFLFCFEETPSIWSTF